MGTSTSHVRDQTAGAVPQYEELHDDSDEIEYQDRGRANFVSTPSYFLHTFAHGVLTFDMKFPTVKLLQEASCFERSCRGAQSSRDQGPVDNILLTRVEQLKRVCRTPYMFSTDQPLTFRVQAFPRWKVALDDIGVE